ncbi:hypothetical protein CLOM_g22043 [Closterium sp. NIES-68]|nr:hypothetical protein CLOM_g22043 [Closterium sp. NIES-68]GJP77772.1 hypothetical protein CLOP_g8119 [Closterium sp. NIES-67]
MKDPVTNQTLPYSEDEIPEVCKTKENLYFKCQRQHKVIVPGFEEEGGVWVDAYIQEWEVCDGKNDCPLGEDEGGTATYSDDEDPAMCATYECVPFYWKCTGGTVCVDRSLLCDGKNDCPVTGATDGPAGATLGTINATDAAAEGAARTTTAGSSAHGSSRTLLTYAADEDPSFCRSEPCPWSKYSRMKCPSTGQCLALEKWCDGVNGDCIDYSSFSYGNSSASNRAAYSEDEDPEVCRAFDCASAFKKCPSGVQCLELSRFCDGTVDCQVGAEPSSSNVATTSAGGASAAGGSSRSSSKQWLHEEEYGFCESWECRLYWNDRHECDHNPYCVNTTLGTDLVQRTCTALDEWAKIQKDAADAAAAAAAAADADNDEKKTYNSAGTSGDSTASSSNSDAASDDSTAASSNPVAASDDSTAASGNPIAVSGGSTAKEEVEKEAAENKRKQEAKTEAAEKKKQKEEAKKVASEKKRQKEEVKKVAAEKKRLKEEAKKEAAEKKGLKEEAKKEAAEKKKQKEDEKKAREAKEKAKREKAEKARKNLR